MNLIFNIGNSNMTIAINKKKNDFLVYKFNSKINDTEDELFLKINNIFNYLNLNINEVKKIGVSSVVLELDELILKLGNKYFNLNTKFLNSSYEINDIKYDFDTPEQAGSDRIANIIASKRNYGNNVIAIDFGTAITLDVLKDGNFIGGIIIPGFQMSMKALFSNTSKIPKIDLIMPHNNIGKNTKDNVQIGIVKNTILGIESIIKNIREETKTKFKIISTGGAAINYLGKSFIFDLYDENLTLKGIEEFLNYEN